jgi:glucosamine 6-phosphate synthetase-like amidotransferase/phosphosugar isomerase protein
MYEEVLKIASTQGLWAVLTVVLVFYILKTQEKRDLRQEERENNYQKIIANLTETISVIEDIRTDIKEIKEHVCKNNM